MKTIDLESWPRREHFAFFRRMDLPFYNVNANVDISDLRQFAKASVLSLNTVLVHLAVGLLNAIDSFRYRLRVGRFFAALECAIGELAAPWRAPEANAFAN